MAEVSDQQLSVLNNAWALLQQMEGNPDAKAHLEQAIKTVKPEVQTEADIAARFAKPYVDQIESLRGDLTALSTSIKEREEQAAQRAQESQFAEAFGRLSKAGYTADGITRIQELMVERKIADPDAAAALFDRLNPPAQHEQPGWSPATWEIGSTAAPTADLKLLFQDEDRWADREAGLALNEIRLGQAA